MKNGAPHIEFALELRRLLKDRGFDSPSDLHRDLQTHMKTNAPAKSTVWMAFYGTRILPIEVVLFLKERYGFDLSWRQVLAVKNIDGTQRKSNQLALPGMRELKR